MPRAMWICKREGLTAMPAPTDYYLKKDPQKGIFDFKPSALKIQMFQSTLHECAGVLKLKFFN